MTRTVTYHSVAGAMLINSTLYYVLKDHLGSASVVTNASVVTVGEQRYYPYGETRLTTGTICTDKLFTGPAIDYVNQEVGPVAFRVMDVQMVIYTTMVEAGQYISSFLP